MFGKVICFFLGHDVFMPLEERAASLVGGVCKRCMKLLPYPKLPKSTGDTVVIPKMVGRLVLKKLEEKK